MKIAVAGRDGRLDVADVDMAFRQVQEELGAEPDLVMAWHSAPLGQIVHDRLRHLAPPRRLIGASSCRGALSNAGHHGGSTDGLVVWGLSDPDGDYGTASAPLGQDPEKAGRAAFQDALAAADRPGELPALVWVHSTPGSEEAVLAGIDSETGGAAPVAGGTAADNEISGDWFNFTSDDIGGDQVSVAVLFPSTDITFSFHSGYSPTNVTGTATAVDGRVVHQIDGRPAAEVYNEWTGGAIAAALGDDVEDRSVLADSTMHPLGVQVGEVRLSAERQIPYHSLLHPERVTEDGGLALFAEVESGQELVLMTGDATSLVNRAANVSTLAQRHDSDDRTAIAGGLVIYCAGCMLAVESEMGQVAATLDASIDGAPFGGAFTFGEQGCMVGGENQHGNLMVSVVLFHDDE